MFLGSLAYLIWKTLWVPCSSNSPPSFLFFFLKKKTKQGTEILKTYFKSSLDRVHLHLAWFSLKILRLIMIYLKNTAAKTGASGWRILSGPASVTQPLQEGFLSTATCFSLAWLSPLLVIPVHVRSRFVSCHQLTR